MYNANGSGSEEFLKLFSSYHFQCGYEDYFNNIIRFDFFKNDSLYYEYGRLFAAFCQEQFILVQNLELSDRSLYYINKIKQQEYKIFAPSIMSTFGGKNFLKWG